MIKASELRIGNLIEYLGNQYKASMIGDLSVAIAVGGTRVHEFIKCEDINPIPLTPEWLAKCGFNKLNAGWINSSGSMCFYDRSRDINGYYTMDYGTRNYVARFKHVHQLQNLYFSLTGEELTIKD